MTKLLTILLTLSILLSLAACGGNPAGTADNPGSTGTTNSTGKQDPENPENPDDPENPDNPENPDDPENPVPPAPEKATYTVTVQSAGGMALKNMDVRIYASADKKTLLHTGTTNAIGQISAELKKGEGYVAVVEGAPAGYTVEESYPITGTETLIALTSYLREGSNLKGKRVTLGSIMYNFSYTDLDYKTHYLSEHLDGHKALLIYVFNNMSQYDWDHDMPFLETLYQQHKDEINILCLYPGGSSQIQDMLEGLYGISFQVLRCDKSWADAFENDLYVIDRYGMVTLTDNWPIQWDAEKIGKVFQYHTAEDYQQTLSESVDKLVQYMDIQSAGQLMEGNQVGNLCPSVELEMLDQTGAVTGTIDPSKTGKITVLYFWWTWQHSTMDLVYLEQLSQTYDGDISIITICDHSTYQEDLLWVLENFDHSMIYTQDRPIDDTTWMGQFIAEMGLDFYDGAIVLNEEGVIVKRYERTGDDLKYSDLEDVLEVELLN